MHLKYYHVYSMRVAVSPSPCDASFLEPVFTWIIKEENKVPLILSLGKHE